MDLEIAKKTKAELQALLIEKRERLRALRFDLVSGKVKNVREVRQTRREIARILTLVNSTTKSL